MNKDTIYNYTNGVEMSQVKYFFQAIFQQVEAAVSKEHKVILSLQQADAVRKLRDVALIATSGVCSTMPVVPRTQSLLIGPSGSGKSFIGQKLAELLGMPCYRVNVSNWTPNGARNEESTAVQIATWLVGLKGGGVLVLDEIDKINNGEQWVQNIRLEIHEILDKQLPLSTDLNCVDYSNVSGGAEVQVLDHSELSQILRHRVMILGCGAWQEAWIGNSRSMGFGANEEDENVSPSGEQILDSISPEIRQRFRNEVILLEPMNRNDYREVMGRLRKEVPEMLRPYWDEISESVIDDAIGRNLGMRVLEELMLKVLQKGMSEFEVLEISNMPELLSLG